jgi:hypothetical protein
MLCVVRVGHRRRKEGWEMGMAAVAAAAAVVVVVVESRRQVMLV